MIDGIFWVIKIAHLEGLRQSLLITLWMKLYKLFFHLLDTGPPTPWGPNEKAITDVEKPERKIRPISLQKETWEQSLSAFLFVGWDESSEISTDGTWIWC